MKRKIYGQYQETKCAFCDKRATTTNKENIPVCPIHVKNTIGSISCICGNILELKHSKYGPFFVCERCGVMSFSKGLSMKNSSVEKGFKLNKSFRSDKSNKELKKEKSVKDLWKDYYGL